MGQITTKSKLSTSELLLRIGVVEVLDVQDVALLIKKSESRVRHMVKDREIPHYKNEQGQITFRKSEIEEWRAQGTRIPTTTEIHQQAVTYTAINTR